MSQLDLLKEELEKLGQGHILSQCPDLSETNHVAKQLLGLNLSESLKHMKEAEKNTFQSMEATDVLPLRDVVEWHSLEAEEKRNIRELGLNAIRAGSVGAVIMSGGQGTRLGFDGPKGMFNMGLPSGRCIFRIHMDKLNAMLYLAGAGARKGLGTREVNDTTKSACAASIPVYIMTNDIKTQTIKDYFRANAFFGYPSEDVYFFEQALEPCLDFSGRLILETETSLAMAPDGNGGIYNALKRSGAIADICRTRSGILIGFYATTIQIRDLCFAPLHCGIIVNCVGLQTWLI
jgi:UDP-N-acetylglucosamine/UDP-N-acetylgalactosamine diphosphorylase